MTFDEFKEKHKNNISHFTERDLITLQLSFIEGQKNGMETGRQIAIEII